MDTSVTETTMDNEVRVGDRFRPLFRAEIIKGGYGGDRFVVRPAKNMPVLTVVEVYEKECECETFPCGRHDRADFGRAKMNDGTRQVVKALLNPEVWERVIMGYEEEVAQWKQEIQDYNDAQNAHHLVVRALSKKVRAVLGDDKVWSVSLAADLGTASIELKPWTPVTIKMMDDLAHLLQTKAIDVKHASADGNGCESCGYGEEEDWIEVQNIPSEVLPTPPPMPKKKKPYQPEPGWSALCTRCLYVAKERRPWGAWCDFTPTAGEKKYCDGLDETGNPCMMRARYEWYPAEL